MVQLLIIKTGSTYPEIERHHGDFDAWFTRALQRDGLKIQVCDVAAGAELSSVPNASEIDAVVITGSPAMVTERAPWSESAASWLGHWVRADKPVLGVCYGHQLLAHALGGSVDYHPLGREMGTLEVTLNASAKGDPLFGDLPPRFMAHLTHRQSVTRLPYGATVLAASAQEANQAFRYGSCAWGVQFHPEFDEHIMTAYMQRLAPVLKDEGRDVDAMISSLQPTDEARQVLHRFVDWVMR